MFSVTSSDGSALCVGPQEYIRSLVPAPPSDEADVAPIKRPTPQEHIKELLISGEFFLVNFRYFHRVGQVLDYSDDEIRTTNYTILYSLAGTRSHRSHAGMTNKPWFFCYPSQVAAVNFGRNFRCLSQLPAYYIIISRT